MCQEVLKIVQKMNQKHIETKLAIYCAPLIAGLKVSNLFIVSANEVEDLSQVLRKTGLVFLKLADVNGRVTFLLFRREELREHLADRKVQQILRECGYEDLSFRGILYRFMERYQAYAKGERNYPHEIGLLLGYPAEDVEGFILHNGQNYLFAGYWKVYADAPQKQELFRQYEAAEQEVVVLLSQGTGIGQIIKSYSGRYQMKLVS